MKRIASLLFVCFVTISVVGILESESIPSRDVPPPPQNVQAEPKDNAVRLTWDPPSGMTGNDLTSYTVFMGTSSDSVNTILGYKGPFENVHLEDGLENGKTYYFSVLAVNIDGQGDKSTPVSATPRGPSSPPQNVEADYDANYVRLTWDQPQDSNGAPVTGYAVFKGYTSNNISIRNEIGNVMEFEDMGLINGKTYYYQIAAITDYGDGDKTQKISVVPRTSPSAPFNLSATGSDGLVTLKWNASLDNGGAFVEGYSIYRGESVEEMEKIGTTTEGLTYTDETVVNGVTYLYSVAAFNSEGDGDLASAVSVKPMGPPGRPENMELKAGDAKVHITWEEPATDGGSEILGYRIYKNKHNEEMELDSDAGDVLEYTVTDLENNQIYYFQVRAYNEVGEGKGSNTSMIRPEPLPKTPENFRVIDMEEQVKLLWNKPTYTGEYPYENVLIYRGETDDSLELHVNISAEFTQYFDEDVEVGKVYYYEISILSSIGEGYRSPTVVGRPYDRPSIPRSLEIRTESEKAFLTWEQPEFTGGRVIENFKVYRGTDPETITVLATVSGTRTYYNDTGLTNGLKYYYKVSAVNKELEGNTTELIEVTPLGPPEEPAKGNGVFDAANGTVEITWNAPDSDGGMTITAYKIYRGPERDNLTFIGEVVPGDTFTDDEITRGEGYYYSVAAVNDQGEGPLSPLFYVEIPVEESDDSVEGPGAIMWIAIVGVVVVIMVLIIILALVSSKKKKKEEEEKKKDIPKLEESEAEREERLIMERRKQMGEFTSISTDTTEAHAADSHEGSSLSYEDLYGPNSKYSHQETNEVSDQVMTEQQVQQGYVQEQPQQQIQYQPPAPEAAPPQQPQASEPLKQDQNQPPQGGQQP